MNDTTALRGGSGLYYGDALGADQSFATGNQQVVVIQHTNDGRPDFAANPTGGQPLPNFEQAQSQSLLGQRRRVCRVEGRSTTTGTAPCLDARPAGVRRAAEITCTCRGRSRRRSASSTRSAR